MAALVVAAALAPTAASAQPAPAAAESTVATEQTPPAAAAPVRACDGCPPRRLGTSFVQVTLVNVLYELANLARGQVTAHITPKTWWTNMKRGWEWDLDDFVVNQIGHPYQGNNYFTTGRANGLNYWESAGLTAFGSGTWEYFGETNQASLNDFINTTLGGIALGEMFHRAAWLVRDTSASRKPGLGREIIATAIDPMTGLNRFLTGDARRAADKPAEFVPSSLGADLAGGVLWRGSNTRVIASAGQPFMVADVLYGDPTRGRSRTPYDAFGVRFELGGGSPISEVRVRGRLLGQPFQNGALQLTVAQGYQFLSNDAFQFGAQSFEGSISFVKALSPRTTLWAAGWGGLTVLGAVDSLPPGGAVEPEEPGEDAGQGVSTGPRYYDYGPGGTVGGFVRLLRDDRPLMLLWYEGLHLHVLDGVRANHFLQRARAEVAVPVRGRLGIGAAAEFFDRRTYYHLPEADQARFYYPQFRAFLTWSAR